MFVQFINYSEVRQYILNMKKITSTIALFIITISISFAQSENDAFRGKMDTVIYVIGVILAGLFFYLFYLDRKLSKLEKNLNNE